MPRPLLRGTVTVFASLLPVIGAASVWIPATLWLFLAEELHGRGILAAKEDAPG